MPRGGEGRGEGAGGQGERTCEYYTSQSLSSSAAGEPKSTSDSSEDGTGDKQPNATTGKRTVTSEPEKARKKLEPGNSRAPDL